MTYKIKTTALFLLILLLSCSKKKTIEFTDKDFENKLASFINKSNINYSSENYVLVYIIEKNQKTFLKLYCTPPFEWAFFQNSIDYKGKTVLFYSNLSSEKTNSIYKIQGTSKINCEDIVYKGEIDLPYQMSYEIKDGKIFRLDEIDNSKNTYKITDKHLIKILKQFIEVSKQHNKQLEIITEKEIINTDIIMSFDISNHKDTVLTFINTKPFTCKNIKGLATINGYNVYLYSTMDKSFLDKKFKITRPLDSCEKYIEKRIMDVNFETSYYVRNNTFIKM